MNTDVLLRRFSADELGQLHTFFGELSLLQREREIHQARLTDANARIRHLTTVLTTLRVLRGQAQVALESGVPLPALDSSRVLPATLNGTPDSPVNGFHGDVGTTFADVVKDPTW